ncbi:type I-E CRISPR-associated protein Cas6/Cse3/CasE [Ligilactobacillus saerimneri]
MYLSRVEIAVRDAQRMRSLTHLGAYHDWVEKSFPDEIEAGVRKRHLWRIDRLNDKYYLLIVSENKPDLDHLGIHGVPGTAMTKTYDNFLAKIAEKKTYRFRLTANPSYKVMQPGKKNGRVYPHITVAQQKKWLAERQEKLGFEFVFRETDQGTAPSFEIVDRDWKILRRKKSRKVELSCVTFEGIIRVTDAEKFKKALTSGIGREKAYGMGLMTVIPN